MTDSEFQKRYKALDERQKQAVDAIEGPVLVLAGPGSGKTEILSLRIANILHKTDTSPSNILCLTFTDSAASTMRQRLQGLIGGEAYRVGIYTFHSFSVDVIERFPEYFYDGANFRPADTVTQLEILETIFSELSHDDPLRKTHPEQGYVYLKDVHTAIGQLKKAGLSPADFRSLLKRNEKELTSLSKILSPAFSKRMHKKEIRSLEKICAHIKKNIDLKTPVRPVSFFLFEALSLAINDAKETGSTKSLTAWKEKWFSKDEKGNPALKDSLSLPKLFSLASIYEAYESKMHTQGFYDFDDMLLQVIALLKGKTSVRLDFQERYHYVLVDEFQDTNDAQMSLLEVLTNHPVNEGRPNLMVVGDDDQAIYKFQGAEVGNILTFKERYIKPKIVTLASNYRSTKDVVDLALHVAKKGENRLEHRFPEIKKTLISVGKEKKGDVVFRNFIRSDDEYAFVADEIERLIKNGTAPSSIAVIGRKHQFLEKIVPYLYRKKIAVNYERQQNVLRDKHIVEIIGIARFLVTLGRKDREEADNLLPEILSYPFWGIERRAIWEISLEASRTRKPWLAIMEKSKNRRIKILASFLVSLSIRSLNEPLEYILDDIIGTHVSLEMLSENETAALPSKRVFVSPFKEYYFGKTKFNTARAEYLVFLSALRVFVQALREYKQGRMLRIDDLIDFVDTHEKNEIILADEGAFLTGRPAVSLLTAHKAKGLEFPVVFVLHCQNEVWTGRGTISKISFPANLPIAPGNDTKDDHMRLFFVAITRAKHTLYLSCHAVGENGRAMSKLSFLVSDKTHLNKKISDILSAQFSVNPEAGRGEKDVVPITLPFYAPPFVSDEKALLLPLLDDYKMSVTHLNNYLNVIHGGPQLFLEQNLLRFPRAKSASASFGSAVHKALELSHRALKKTGTLPTRTRALGFFETSLQEERLSQADYARELKRGIKSLTAFYESQKKNWSAEQLVEVNFSRQNVVISGVPLSGKIDKLEKLAHGRMKVYDWKTGAPCFSWKASGVYDKVKLHQYAEQLIFYKILLEHSKDFSDFEVTEGILQFIEPKGGKLASLSLSLSEKETSRMVALIVAVYKKILALEFPSVEKYEKNLSGIIAFEDDILKGNI
ncbi:MAG: ATP-dependent DNA helicase [Patescibacteria group bacterium]|nr:ATP-dependent DNA helicase [bacterium]MDZ4241094.1 ATP-dependent DNA helicase [Patescibacteria group bacterium]